MLGFIRWLPMRVAFLLAPYLFWKVFESIPFGFEKREGANEAVPRAGFRVIHMSQKDIARPGGDGSGKNFISWQCCTGIDRFGKTGNFHM